MRCIHAGIFPCFRQIVALLPPLRFCIIWQGRRDSIVGALAVVGCVCPGKHVISGCRYIRVPGSVYSRKYSRRDG